MKLLTQRLIRRFPAWGSFKEKDMADLKVICKFELPMTCREWYAIEYDGLDEFYGLIKDERGERLDYFMEDELYRQKGPMGVKVVRNKWFSSCKLIDFMKRRFSRIP